MKFEIRAFKVGLESVGSYPDPFCYRKGGELAVRYANFVLGRVIPYYFPSIFGPNENEQLYLEETREAFFKLTDTINSYRREKYPSSRDISVEEIALGFIDVANEAMYRPR